MDEWIKEISKDKKIESLVKEFVKIENNLESYIKENYELRWNVIEFRKFLKKIMNKELLTLKQPNLFNNFILIQFEQKMDLIFAPIIADLRSDEWHDYRLAAIFIVRCFSFAEIMGLHHRKFLNKWNPIDIQDNIRKNTLVLQSKPLLEFEINELNKRIIFAMFGGIKNINNISLVQYKFARNDEEHNNDNGDIMHYYLQVNIKNKNLVTENDIAIDQWNSRFISYYNFLESGLLKFDQYDESIDPNLHGQIIKDNVANQTIKENNYLFEINYSEINKNVINKLISEWNELINFDLQNMAINEVIDNIWTKSIDPIIERFKAQIKSLAELSFAYDKLKKQIISEINRNLMKIKPGVDPLGPSKAEEYFKLITEHIKANN